MAVAYLSQLEPKYPEEIRKWKMLWSPFGSNNCRNQTPNSFVYLQVIIILYGCKCLIARSNLLNKQTRQTERFSLGYLTVLPKKTCVGQQQTSVVLIITIKLSEWFWKKEKRGNSFVIQKFSFIKMLLNISRSYTMLLETVKASQSLAKLYFFRWLLHTSCQFLSFGRNYCRWDIL